MRMLKSFGEIYPRDPEQKHMRWVSSCDLCLLGAMYPLDKSISAGIYHSWTAGQSLSCRGASQPHQPIWPGWLSSIQTLYHTSSSYQVTNIMKSLGTSVTAATEQCCLRALTHLGYHLQAQVDCFSVFRANIWSLLLLMMDKITLTWTRRRFSSEAMSQFTHWTRRPVACWRTLSAQEGGNMPWLPSKWPGWISLFGVFFLAAPRLATYFQERGKL